MLKIDHDIWQKKPLQAVSIISSKIYIQNKYLLSHHLGT